MKIAIFVCEFPKLSETFIINQITGLLDAGHDIDIFPDSQGNTNIVQEDVKRYDLLKRAYHLPYVPSNRLYRLIKAIWLLITHLHRNPFALLKSLNIYKYGRRAASLLLFYQTIAIVRGHRSYDVIHCHFGNRGVEALKYIELGVVTGKLLVSFHGIDANVGSIEERQKKYQELFLSNAWFTANTIYTKSKLVQIGCNETRIFQLYVGLRTEDFPFQIRVLPSDGVVNFLTIARLTEKKGLYYSICAFKRVLERGIDASYHIIGDGELYNELTALSRELQLVHKITFHGGMDSHNIRKIADCCHIFVLASVQAANGDSEGQGLVLQEAQAMGMPVISTNHNGIPEGVLEGQSAFLVPERDIDSLAEQMINLAYASHNWPTIGLSGRKFVEERFSNLILTKKLIQIYNQIT